MTGPLDLGAVEARLLALHNREKASVRAAAFLVNDAPALVRIARAGQALVAEGDPSREGCCNYCESDDRDRDGILTSHRAGCVWDALKAALEGRDG